MQSLIRTLVDNSKQKEFIKNIIVLSCNVVGILWHYSLTQVFTVLLSTLAINTQCFSDCIFQGTQQGLRLRLLSHVSLDEGVCVCQHWG